MHKRVFNKNMAYKVYICDGYFFIQLCINNLELYVNYGGEVSVH